MADIQTLPSADVAVVDQYIAAEMSGKNVNVCTDVTPDTTAEHEVTAVTAVFVSEQVPDQGERVSPTKLLQVDKSSLSFSPNFSARKLSASG